MDENKSGKLQLHTATATATANHHRPALGDVTNQLPNRGFPFLKPLSGTKRSVHDIYDDDSHLLSVRLSPLRGGKTYRLQSGSRHVVNLEAKDGGLRGCSEKRTVEVEKEGLGASDCSVEELGARVLSDSDMTLSSRSTDDVIESSRFRESLETQSIGVERCTLVKGDGSNSFHAHVDPLKNCSCSFCTKAAFIWSDLQCQDVKGRISTLAKSRKEASNLAQRYSKETAMQGKSSIAPHLHTDLTTLWSSLFLHMDTLLDAETNQLESNFAVLKELREERKMKLEMINALPSDMQQQYTFHASEPTTN